MDTSGFTITNGCRQGVITYFQILLSLLKQMMTGCWVLGNFHGIIGYNDDNWQLVIVPSLAALQRMLRTCEKYAGTYLQPQVFLRSKSHKVQDQVDWVLKTKRHSLLLCGNPFPCMDRLKHLGNTFTG